MTGGVSSSERIGMPDDFDATLRILAMAEAFDCFVQAELYRNELAYEQKRHMKITGAMAGLAFGLPLLYQIWRERRLELRILQYESLGRQIMLTEQLI